MRILIYTLMFLFATATFLLIVPFVQARSTDHSREQQSILAQARNTPVLSPTSPVRPSVTAASPTSTSAQITQPAQTTLPAETTKNSGTPDPSTQKKKGGIEIRPALIDVEITEDEPEKEVEFSLINHGSKTVTLELTPINFRQKDLTGIVEFLGETTETFTYSLASYIHLPYTEVQIEPNEKRDIPVIIRNRQDLSPGGHYAGIIARLKAPDRVDEKVTAVLPSVTTLIFLRKTGGEQFNLSIQGVNWPNNVIEFTYPQRLSITFQNEGNVHLTPYGRVEIRDMFNRLVGKGIINVASSYVFPSSRRRIEIDLNRTAFSLPISFNTLSIRGQDSLKKTNFIHQETYVYIDPRMLGFFVLFAIGMLYRKKRRLPFSIKLPW